MNQTTDKTRAAWGDGRIVFAAHSAKIQQLINQGWPLKKIYRELEDALSGLSYQQFTYHIRRQSPSADKPKPLTENLAEIINEPVEGDTHEKPKTTANTRFKPGPRVPDPSQLY